MVARAVLQRAGLEPRVATQAWLRRGLTDFFVAHEMIELIRFRAFALHQGVEKCAKAYLIASQASRYASLPKSEAEQWIDRFAKDLGHDLESLVGLVGIGVPDLKSWLADGILEWLNKAYEEERYPRPYDRSFWKDPGWKVLVSHRIDEKAFAIGMHLHRAIDEQFGFVVSLKEPSDRGISTKAWVGFINRFGGAHGFP